MDVLILIHMANQFLPHGIICAFPQKLKNHYDCSYLNDPIS
jgi:hypothetical protein